MSKKWILHIAVFLCCFPISVGFSQENSQFDKKWENIHERIDYRKPNRPAEPNAVYTYPPSLNEQDNSPNKTNTSSNKPADDEIIYSRKKRYNNSDDSGVEKHIKKNEDDDFDDRIFSARILGRKAKSYLDESMDLETRIFEVLEANTVNAEESRIAKSWAIQKDWDLEYCVALLEEFKAGLSEGIS